MDKFQANSYCILGGIQYKFIREFEAQDGYKKQNYTCQRCNVGLVSLIPAVKVWRLVTYHSKDECYQATKELIKKYHQQGDRQEWKSFKLRVLQDIPEEEIEEVSEYLEPLSTSEDDSSWIVEPTANASTQELHPESSESVSEYLEELSTVMSENELPTTMASESANKMDSIEIHHKNLAKKRNDVGGDTPIVENAHGRHQNPIPIPTPKQQKTSSHASIVVPSLAYNQDSIELHRKNLAKKRNDFGGHTSIVELETGPHQTFIPAPKPKKTPPHTPIVAQIPCSTSTPQGLHEESPIKAKPKQTLMTRMKEKVFQPKATNSMEVFTAKKWGESSLEKIHHKHSEMFKEAKAKLSKAKDHFSSKR